MSDVFCAILYFLTVEDLLSFAQYLGEVALDFDDLKGEGPSLSLCKVIEQLHDDLATVEVHENWRYKLD